MLSGLDGMFYPMTADIYYSTQTQNNMGEVVKTWNRDRTIACSAIKRNTDSRVAAMIDPQKFLEYDILVAMRMREDILQSSDSTLYYITDILVKNIKDANNMVVWKETIDKPTIFEVMSIEPMYNMFSVLDGYRALLVRSDNQDI